MHGGSFLLTDQHVRFKGMIHEKELGLNDIRLERFTRLMQQHMYAIH